MRVLRGADIWCMDTNTSRAEAIAWSGARIVAVGSEQEVLAVAGAGATLFDAGGATVVPGFVDGHHHVSIATLYSGRTMLTGPDVTDIPSLQARLANASKKLEPGQWLVATDWDEALLRERRAPTRQELDDAVPDRPLFAMHYTCHRAAANSRALALAGIDRHTPEPQGGVIARGPGGEPSGLLVERGMSPVEALARADLVSHDAEGYLRRLSAHYARMVATGITRVVDAAVPPELVTLYREADRRGAVTIPTVMMPVGTRGWLEEPWEVLEGPATGHRDGNLTIGPVKLVFDGAPSCAMCLGFWQSLGAVFRTWALTLQQGSLDALRTTLSIQPRLGADLKMRSGIAIYRREQATKIIATAASKGFAVATHAIGNDAIDTALAAYADVGVDLHAAGTARIEHATYLSPEMVQRLADQGVAAVFQPHLLTLPSYAHAASIPGLRAMPLRWALDRGVLVSGSSDYPVAAFAPLAGIRSAVRRETRSGAVFEPDQCIDVEEAVALYTRNAATAAGCIAECGTLEVGKRADLVLLSGRIDTDFDTLDIRATVVGGATLCGSL